MKTIILAGGRGTRLSEYTHSIPKPMVEIGEYPLLWHLMSSYASHGFKDFAVALGYKGNIIKEYFLNHRAMSSDCSIDLGSGEVKTFKRPDSVDWNVALIDTGLNTMTGGRVKRLQEIIGKERFFLTYGDGLSDVDLKALLSFHKSHGKLVTVTAVHPVARFGEIEFGLDGKVSRFKEKPQTTAGWINGGFFVIEPKFLELLDDDSTVLEREPLETAARKGELVAFKHEGFWHCMDTVRDRDVLQEIWDSGEAPWLTR